MNYSDNSVYLVQAPVSLAWTTPERIVLGTTYAVSWFCVANNGTHIAVAYFWGTVNDYYFLQAKINADYSLTWSGAVKVIDGVTYSAQETCVYWGNGRWWYASGYDGASGSYVFQIKNSVNGVTWGGTENLEVGTSPVHCRYVTMNWATSGTTTYCFYNDYYAGTNLYYRSWTGTTIGSKVTYTLTVGMTANAVKDQLWAMCTDSSGTMWFVWVGSDNKLYSRSFTGSSWSGEVQLDNTASCLTPNVGYDSMKGEIHFYWIRSGAIYERIRYDNGTLGTATTPFSGNTNTPTQTAVWDIGGFMACMWIDNDKTVKLGIVNNPPAQMKIYYYKTSTGSFYVNSVSVANGSSLLCNNGTSLSLMALPDSGYGWKNYTVGANAYTANAYTYTVIANVSIWCHFFLPGTPTPYITARFRFSPTNGTVNHNVTFTDLSVSSGSITGYNWSFGDISFSLLQNPSHNYTAIGLYNVTLTISGAVGSNLMWHGLNVSSDYVAQIADVAGLANLDFILVIVAVVLAIIGLLFWASKRD